jgi:two-component system response regulator FixJ
MKTGMQKSDPSADTGRNFTRQPATNDEQHVFIVDDDENMRTSVRGLLETEGFGVSSYGSGKQFLADTCPKTGCLITDIRMPDMNGLDLQQEIIARGIDIPVIIITGHSDVPLAVRAMRAGAIDFIEKPFGDELILRSVERALEAGATARSQGAEAKAAQALLALLTPRERDVVDQLVKGRSNKIVAHELGISPRTVEVHRSNAMGKLNAVNLADMVRTVLEALSHPGTVALPSSYPPRQAD